MIVGSGAVDGRCLGAFALTLSWRGVAGLLFVGAVPFFVDRRFFVRCSRFVGVTCVSAGLLFVGAVAFFLTCGCP